MSTYTAIAEVGNTLMKLIYDNLSKEMKEEVGVAGITLSSPEDDINGTLSVFLYQIIEDSYQKNQGMLPDGSKLKKPPTALRLFYMITPHLKKVQGDRVLKEHQLIGNIIQIFSDNPVLTSPFLEGSLADYRIKLIANTLSIDEINKIWSIISKSKPYMLSIYYEVAPVRIDSTREMEMVKVKSAELKSEIKTI